jgi:hypothetical protein
MPSHFTNYLALGSPPIDVATKAPNALMPPHYSMTATARRCEFANYPPFQKARKRRVTSANASQRCATRKKTGCPTV